MKTVMIVDDEDDLLEVVRDFLEAEGYRVVTAHNGAEGLEVARREQPDMIFLDLSMPGGMDGFEMLDLLRRRKDIAGIPVVMLTARGRSGDILDAESLQAMDYMIKPFTGEELLREVRRTIG